MKNQLSNINLFNNFSDGECSKLLGNNMMRTLHRIGLIRYVWITPNPANGGIIDGWRYTFAEVDNER